jgi:long-chain acyl-CoA synthetase
MVRIDDASAPKRRMVHFFLDVARRVERRRLAHEPVPLGDRVLYQVGRVLVYGPLRDNLGMRRIRVAYTAGEAIGPELFEFYRSLGINVKQLYGMTESSALVCIQQDGDVKLDTVGTPLPGVELRISDSGEVMYRSPGVFAGYYKNPEATRETLEDGWIHSGDAGVIDKDGHLKIIDRAKDVGRLTDGTLFAPKYLENKLKFSPYVKEAVCVGPGRPFVAALVNIDLGSVGSWAERRNIAYTSYTDLAQKPEVYELIRQEVERVNRSLLGEAALSGAQIRRFLLLHKELDADDQEITRTRKVRRGFVGEKYAALIDALYSESDVVKVEAQVTYEDGRTATVRADVRIRDAETFAACEGMTDHGRASGPLLAVEDVSVNFGAVQALTRVSLDIRRGETVAIIGPNGAGKTTLLNVISGFYHASSGRILYEGRDRTHLAPTTWPRSASRGRFRTWPSSRA